MTQDHAVPQRILVTGAAGFVGRRLVERLGVVAPEATVLPVLGPYGTAGSQSIDLADTEACLALVQGFRPTMIVHLAALSSVGTTMLDPQAVWRSNFDGTRSLALAARSLDADVRFVFASSGEVYGARFNDGPCDEDAALAPQSPYARTKAACEYLLRDVAKDKLTVIAMRLFNHSGPGQDERFVTPSFAGQIARLEQAGGGEIKVGNLDAERDFSDIDDIIDAYVAVVQHERAPQGFSVFNVGSGQTRSVRSILDKLVSLAQTHVEPVADPQRMRPTDVPVAAGVFDRFRAEFGWTAKRSFDTTIGEVLQDQRSRAAGK